MVFGLVYIEQVDLARVQTESVDETSLTTLQLELSSLQKFPRWHEEHVTIAILAENSNELGVYETTVDRNLVFHKLGECLPYFRCFAQGVSHEAFRIASCHLLELG